MVVGFFRDGNYNRNGREGRREIQSRSEIWIKRDDTDEYAWSGIKDAPSQSLERKNGE